MSTIHLKPGVSQATLTPTPRTPIRTYHPDNAPTVTACVTYRSDDGRIVARSERGASGILRNPPAIAWDAGVIDQLTRDDVDDLEVFVRDTGTTYRAELATMRMNCRYQNRYGLQTVLSLKYWRTSTSSVDGQPARPPLPPAATAPQPAVAQLNLLGESAL